MDTSPLLFSLQFVRFAPAKFTLKSVFIETLVFLGPLSSILSVKYSYRTVTLLGGTFAAVGMMLSFFAGSVAYLYIR